MAPIDVFILFTVFFLYILFHFLYIKFRTKKLFLKIKKTKETTLFIIDKNEKKDG